MTFPDMDNDDIDFDLESPTATGSVDDMFKVIQDRRLIEALDNSPKLRALVRLLQTYHESASEHQRQYQVEVIFTADDISLTLERDQVRLKKSAFPYFLVWLIKVRDLSKTPKKTKDKIQEIVGWIGHDKPFLDGEAIVSHLKERGAFLFEPDFDRSCLYCIKESRSKTSLYCGEGCKKNISEFVNELAKQPFHHIESKIIKRLGDKGLAYQLGDEY